MPLMTASGNEDVWLAASFFTTTHFYDVITTHFYHPARQQHGTSLTQYTKIFHLFSYISHDDDSGEWIGARCYWT